MLYLDCPINDSYDYLYITVYLAVMLQACWHTEEGNWESKGSYIKSWYCKNFILSILLALLDMGPEVFSEMG